MSDERILCAAILYIDQPTPKQTLRGVNGLVLCGFSHAHIVSQHVSMLGKRQVEMGAYEQGFITTHQRFVGRTEAAKIHVANGGTLHYSTTELYSEDLHQL